MDEIYVEIDHQQIATQAKALAALSVNRKDMRAYITKLIRKELGKARANISKDIKSAVSDDPRAAYRAVRYAVWKQVLGGQVNILASKRAGTRYKLIKERKLDQNPNQRGGNRLPRSKRTEDLDTYYGKDRSFVLRFLNSGAGVRNERQSRFGNRGSITGRNFFAPSALKHLDTAAEHLGEMITEILAYEFEREQNN